MQNFKGDALELKMQSVADPVFDQTDLALDEFYSGGFDCNEFLLMLYDESRMPFSERINRDAFIGFIKEALINFPFIGTFESYIFILLSIFGDHSIIEFTLSDPGKLAIKINAVVDIDYDFISREFINGAYSFYEMIDYDDANITFRGISGIDTQYELDLLFSEIIPAGITPTVTLFFFSEYDWLDDEVSDEFTIIDDDDDKIIFIEGGG